MPTYDYQCEKCGHTFEYFQSMNDEPLSLCGECGGSLKRLIGGGLGVIFKGSGFYVTDNKAKSSTAPSSSAKTSAESKSPSVKKETAVSSSGKSKESSKAVKSS